MTDFDKIKQWIMNNIIGICLLISGLVFLAIARGILINVMFFSGGIYLIYLGLVKMKVTKAVNFIDQTILKLKEILKA